ncbi:MAG: DUF2905 domain-containing protein [Candidatus Aminicenantes bacterium]|nr:DUF2905 domain-containing protein [Candidatus Aminicenantes bacterium]
METKAAGNFLIAVGLCLLLLGLFLRLGLGLKWLGRLPGDILIQREKFTFYVPLATGLLLSLLLSLVLLLIVRLTGKH